jgi:hypothetical protein
MSAFSQSTGDRLKHHFEQAEGLEFERVCIAAAMSAIEQKRLELSPSDQAIFMIAYECAVMWFLTRAMQELLKPDEIESVVLAIKGHFAKHAWYETEAFEKIWNKMQIDMPVAIKPDDRCPPYPLAGMIMAVQGAGYPLDVNKLLSLKFGLYVGVRLGTLAGLGRSFAADFNT